MQQWHRVVTNGITYDYMFEVIAKGLRAKNADVDIDAT